MTKNDLLGLAAVASPLIPVIQGNITGSLILAVTIIFIIAITRFGGRR